MSHTDSQPVPHPAPERGAVRRLIMWYALLGAALAFSFDELANYVIAANECTLHTATGTPHMVRGTEPWYIGLIVVTLVAALAGLWAAGVSWRRTRAEHPGGPGEHVAEHGEGRTRFMALCALLTSGVMVLGLVFMLLQLLSAPLCEK